MVRSKKQSNKNFPFFSQQNTNNNPLDSTDRALSNFAIAFFGIILLLISFDSRTTTSSPLVQQVKMGSVANIATPDIFIPTTKTLEIKNTLVSNKKKIAIVEVAKPVFASHKNLRPSNTSTTVEIIRTPVSYASKPVAINRTPIANTAKPFVKKVVKKEFKRVKTKKVTTTKVKKRISSKNKLVINQQISEDLLPASYFAAKQKALQSGKPMLIKFGAKWCLPCREMEKSVFKNPQVQDFMKSNYETLTIDIDDFDGYNMKAYYNISALPTMLVFNAQGEFLAKYINSMSTTSFMSMLKEHQSSVITTTQPIVNQIPVEKKADISTAKTTKPILLPRAEITQVIAKRKNGHSIQTLKGKAKNWRSTALEFQANHLTTGQLIVNIRNLTSGEILNEQTISLAPQLNVGAITDTTTSIFRLDISHEKKKDKSGEYAIEIYHASPQKVRLIGKTSFLKDGQFIWTK